MANHGLLDRKAMDDSQLHNALVNVLKVDPVISYVLTLGANSLGHPSETNGKNIITSLKDLSKHGAIEHDASLTRPDINLSNGDAVSFNSSQWHQLKSLSKDGTFLTLKDLATFRALREDGI